MRLNEVMGMEEQKPYERLKFYQDICNIRTQVHSLTQRFDKSHLRLISQMRDAARSAKQNIREGYRKGSLAGFINSIRISQGSLEELSGDMEDCLEDKLISEVEYTHFLKFYKSASYLSNQYIKAMNKPTNKSSWKIFGKSE